jgi:hypothetical protein
MEKAPVTEGWPAAFMEHAKPNETTPETKFAATSSAPASLLVPAVLHQKVSRACGGLAREVRVVTMPDRTIHVQVRPMSPETERQMVDRLMKMPELSMPDSHIVVDLLP